MVFAFGRATVFDGTAVFCFRTCCGFVSGRAVAFASGRAVIFAVGCAAVLLSGVLRFLVSSVLRLFAKCVVACSRAVDAVYCDWSFEIHDMLFMSPVDLGIFTVHRNNKHQNLYLPH